MGKYKAGTQSEIFHLGRAVSNNSSQFSSEPSDQRIPFYPRKEGTCIGRGRWQCRINPTLHGSPIRDKNNQRRKKKAIRSSLTSMSPLSLSLSLSLYPGRDTTRSSSSVLLPCATLFLSAVQPGSSQRCLQRLADLLHALLSGTQRDSGFLNRSMPPLILSASPGRHPRNKKPHCSFAAKYCNFSRSTEVSVEARAALQMNVFVVGRNCPSR